MRAGVTPAQARKGMKHDPSRRRSAALLKIRASREGRADAPAPWRWKFSASVDAGHGNPSRRARRDRGGSAGTRRLSAHGGGYAADTSELREADGDFPAGAGSGDYEVSRLSRMREEYDE